MLLRALLAIALCAVLTSSPPAVALPPPPEPPRSAVLAGCRCTRDTGCLREGCPDEACRNPAYWCTAVPDEVLARYRELTRVLRPR